MLTRDFKSSNIQIAVIGASKVGKTTLLSAISLVKSGFNNSVFYNRDEIKPEIVECKNGVKFEVASISYESDFDDYTLFDFKTVADFLKCLITNTIRIDGIIYVAQAEGFFPYGDRLALSFSKKIGINKVITYLNKADEVDSDLLEMTEFEVEDLMESMGFDLDNCPHFSGSAYEAVEYSETYELSQMIEILEKNINIISYSEKEEYFENTYEAAIYVYQRDETGNSKPLAEKGVIEFSGNGKYFECELKTDKDMLLAGDFDIIELKFLKYVKCKRFEEFVVYDIKNNSQKVATGFILKDI